jgi:hypothetical protein
MALASAWLSGMAFMAATAVAFPVSAHDFDTAAFLFASSAIMALICRQQLGRRSPTPSNPTGEDVDG